MKIELTQAELVVAVDFYFNQVKFKDKVKVVHIKPQTQNKTVLHVDVETVMSEEESK